MIKNYMISLFLLLSIGLNAQSYYIGSSKNDVLDIQGEPTKISNYQNEEIWAYGEYGLATITFRNGKVFEYSNYDNLLKVKVKKNVNNSSQEKPDVREVFKRLNEDPELIDRESKALKDRLEEKGYQDITGMGYTMSGTSGYVPETYRDEEDAISYSTSTLSPEDAEAKYQRVLRKRWTNRFLIGGGFLLFVIFIVMLNRRFNKISEEKTNSKFTDSFTDEQKVAMIYCLTYLSSANDKYDDNMLEFAHQQSTFLNIDMESPIGIAQMEGKSSYAFSRLSNLTSNQKSYFSVLLSSCLSLGNHTENDLKLLSIIIDSVGITKDEYNKSIEKANSISSNFFNNNSGQV